MPTVAEMIAEAMARKGYSQQRLAKETGLTTAWVNMILRRSRPPGPAALLKIADALGLDRRTLVRQANYERAYPEWKPWLDQVEEDKDAGAFQIPVIGTASAGGESGEVALDSAQEKREVTCRGADANDSAQANASGPCLGVGFGKECRAILVQGDSLEPVAYDGQYVVISPTVRKEDIPDGSIVYVTYELPGESTPRAVVKRMYRNRLPGDPPGSPLLPVYNLIPVNTHLRRKGRGPEPETAITLRHRQVREMYPVVGVIFEPAFARTASPLRGGAARQRQS